jgi:hypothetical protein
MTIRRTAGGTFEMVLRDDFTGPCSGPSTDTGTGTIGPVGLVISSIETVCKNRSRPVGAGDSLVFVHRPGTARIRDNVGVVWTRP